LLFNRPNTLGVCIFSTKDIWKKSGGFPENFFFAEDYIYGHKCKKAGGKFGILNNSHIITNMRRFEEEGRVGLISRYIFYEFYSILFGYKKKAPFSYKLHGEE